MFNNRLLTSDFKHVNYFYGISGRCLSRSWRYPWPILPHQPLCCSYLNRFGNRQLTAGIMLGGSLQFIGTIGQTLKPQLHLMLPLASVAAAIIMGGDFSIKESLSLKVSLFHLQLLVFSWPWSTVPPFRWFALHCRSLMLQKRDIKGVERAHFFLGLLLQVIRIAIPAALFLMIPCWNCQTVLNKMPKWLSDLNANRWYVGYAMAINMMATMKYGHSLRLVLLLQLLANWPWSPLSTSVLPRSTFHFSKKGGNGGGGAATSTRSNWWHSRRLLRKVCILSWLKKLQLSKIRSSKSLVAFNLLAKVLGTMNGCKTWVGTVLIDPSYKKLYKKKEDQAAALSVTWNSF